MISRTFQKGDAASEAQYSDCEHYRYMLTRIWEPQGRKALFIMLNPSTATERQNDPTVERCERRARHLGYGAFRVCNIFALRSTDPKGLYKHPDPIGPDNDRAILASLPWADITICAWGTHAAHLDRHRQLCALLSEAGPLYHLGLSKYGFPKHPLYISYDQQPMLWEPSLGYS